MPRIGLDWPSMLLKHQADSMYGGSASGCKQVRYSGYLELLVKLEAIGEDDDEVKEEALKHGVSSANGIYTG